MSTRPWRWDSDILVLELQVQPRASRNEVVGLRDMGFKVRVAAAPVDGQANAELVKLLAREFGVSKSKIRVIKGTGSRHKPVAVSTPNILPEWLACVLRQDATSDQRAP